MKKALFLLSFAVFSFLCLFFPISSKAQDAVPPPTIDCDKTDDPEFHSLRPYQSSPCQEEIVETALMCGNSLILSDSVSGICYPGDDCSFTEDRKKEFAINLSEAELPILGNTEDVKNSQSSEDSISDTDKVNDYVSWYLQGAPYTPEYEPDEDSDKLVNLAGPIRKLLPISIIHQAQIETLKSAEKTRHDQIVVCESGDDPKECYNGDGSKASGELRISDWGTGVYDNDQGKGLGITRSISNSILRFAAFFGLAKEEKIPWDRRYPPLPKDFSKSIYYQKAYQEWRGESCIILTGKLFCLDLLADNKWADLFPYVPLASTEDLKGEVSVDSASVSSRDKETVISNVDFKPQSADLYFSHIEESVELAELLQSTFSSREALLVGAPTLVSTPTQKCDLVNVRSNPGDQLFPGEIKGSVTYTVDFSCEYNGIEEEKCDKNISINIGTKTKTPKGDEIWSRLVAGPSSVFKRIFPKVGRGSAIEAILDIPASTEVTFSGDGVNVKSPRGGNPELYFAHIGGVQEYFLKGIQTALRPKGYGEAILSGTAGTINPSGPVTCDINAPEASLSRTKSKEDLWQLALDWVPGQTGNKVLECYNDVVAKSNAAGINPVLAFWIWLHESNASNYDLSVLDFGVISVAERDFNAQISAFLATAQGYSSPPANCPSGTTGMQAFAYIYATGQCDPDAPIGGFDQTAGDFYNQMVAQWGWISSCPVPNNPTDTSCQ